MKVKILTNVLHRGTHMKKDQVHELDDKEGQRLVDQEHAEEVKEPRRPAASGGNKGNQGGNGSNGGGEGGGNQETGVRAELMAKTKEQLLTYVAAWNVEHPSNQITVDAQNTKAEIVEAIVTVAGYKQPTQ